jgi:hypothetical protein
MLTAQRPLVVERNGVFYCGGCGARTNDAWRIAQNVYCPACAPIAVRRG